MTLDRRTFIHAAAAVAAIPAAHAQQWPARPIKLVIGHPPGAAADATAKALLPHLQRTLGQSIIVDYRPGAGGMIAAQQVAGTAPDGYTIYLMDNAPATIVPQMRRNGFDALRALTVVATVVRSATIALLHPQLEANDLASLVSLARRTRLTYGSSGNGSIQHLAGQMLNLMARINIAHIPYKGGAPALNDLLAGQISMTFSSLAPAIPFIQAERLRPLALTSKTRFSALPSVPTFAELGLTDLDVTGWFCLAAPPGLPDAIAGRLEDATRAATADPEFQERMVKMGLEAMTGGRDSARALVASDSARWRMFFDKVTIVE